WVEQGGVVSAGRDDPPMRPSALVGVWQSRWIGLLWWLLVPAFVASVAEVRRRPRVAIIALVGTLLALYVRFGVFGGPANHYTEVLGPWNAATAAYVPRAGGADGFYRAIDSVWPLTDGSLFGIQRVLGALSVGLVVLALGIGRDRDRSSDVVL